MPTPNHRIVLAARPDGAVRETDFRLETADLPDPADGQVLIRNTILSLDPYMRMRMNDVKSYVPPQALNEVMGGGTVGEVVISRNPKFAPGDLVAAPGGWQNFCLSDGAGMRKLDRALPPVTYLGPAGMPGVTAWFGVMHLIAPKPGQTVVVSAAAGAVGSVAGQLAKSLGARVVGVAGGPEKCRHVVEALGFDACVDHRANALNANLAAAAPGGVDGVFENVGGAVMDACIRAFNPFARVALCGLVSGGYAARPMPIADATPLLTMRAHIQGFIISDHPEMFAPARDDLQQRIISGALKWHVSEAAGLAAAPAAFIGLLAGKNLGKQVVKLT